MFDRLGRLAVAHPRKIVLAWVVLALVCTILAPDWRANSQDDDISFLPAHSPSVRAHRLMERAFPDDVSASRLILVVERPDAALSRDDFALVDRLVGEVRTLARTDPSLEITHVFSHRDGPIGERLVSDDRRCTLVQISLGSPYLALRTMEAVNQTDARIAPIRAEGASTGLHLFATGPAGIGRDLIHASANSLDYTTIATVILVMVVLLLVYRSPVLALIPLTTIGLAVWVSLQLLALATLIPEVRLVTVSQVFAIVILFGAGTDYCVFLISRYRETLDAGEIPRDALSHGVGRVGWALSASAGTTICGLGMMGTAQFGKISSAGPVIGLSLVVGLAAALTLTPALMRLAGRYVFWPRRMRRGMRLASRPALRRGVSFRGGFWEATSRYVVRRPGVVLTVALLPLIPLALLGLRVEPNFTPIGDLHPSSDSVRGLATIQSHFTAGETGPMTVLLTANRDWESEEGRELIELLSQGFALLPNVAEVRSLTQPLGHPEETPPPPPVTQVVHKPSFLRFDQMFTALTQKVDTAVQGLTQEAIQSHYLATLDDEPDGMCHVARIDVVMHSNPFDNQSVETLDLLETWTEQLLPARAEQFATVRAEVFGVTVHGRDMAVIVQQDRSRVNLLVLAGILLILIVVVRRVWLAGYLLVTVLFSYYVTLGATALFASWLYDQPLTELGWRVPFFLFVLLVAVGEDYNILLVTRILEERREHGSIEGVRRGLASTGGTITACGMIMAGTFATLMLSGLATLVQVGFALSLGILLDTFLIRPFLVPAFMLLVWRNEESPEAEADVIPFSPSLEMPCPGRKAA